MSHARVLARALAVELYRLGFLLIFSNFADLWGRVDLAEHVYSIDPE